MPESTFVLKLSDNADIIAELEKLAREKEISYGLFVDAVGKLKSFELIGNGPKGSIEKLKSDESFQVNAVSGKIQKAPNGKPSIYMRISITKSGFTPRAGQLISGKASESLEIGVRKVDIKKIIGA